jgi:hypothetical protein
MKSKSDNARPVFTSFTSDELLRLERSAWHYARKFVKETRLVPPGPGYTGIREYYFKRAMWHRDHAKQMRLARQAIVAVNS